MFSFRTVSCLIGLFLIIIVIAAPDTRAAPLSDPKLFVEQQYLDFLGRQGEPEGVNYWVQSLNSNTISRAQCVEAFYNSQEFQSNIAPIVRLYRAYFGRIPDYSGLQFWIDAYLKNTPLSSISQQFAESAEFRNLYGSLDNQQFVNLVYQNVLRRNPDTAGFNYWLGQLQNGMSRGQMMVNFSESEEYKTLTRYEVQTIMIYVGMLRRSPDQGGFDFWVAELASGRSVLDLIGQFLSSTEYAARFGNAVPVASSLSVQSNSATPYVQLQLIGTDPDNDPISYVLLPQTSQIGYLEAFVTQSGKLNVTLDSSGATVVLLYQVTDGKNYSEPATVTITVNTSSDQKGLGSNEIDARTYGSFNTLKPYGDLLGAPGSAPTIPPSQDLSPSFPVPGDQGNQGSCVGWATAYALKSYYEKRDLGWDLNRLEHLFSPAFIYNQIKEGSCDAGSRFQNALNLLKDQGAATLDQMPYTDTDCSVQPTDATRGQAANFKIRDWGTLRSSDDVKAELANRRPVVMGINVYQSFQQLRGSNSVYNTFTGSNLGGHAVTIVGYDDSRYGGAFKVINSWGTGWGDNGFFWLPYQEFANQQVVRYAFSVEDIENSTPPGPIEPPQPPPAQLLPNLEITSWEATYDPRPQGSGQLRYVISNSGTATAPSGAYVNLMLSQNQDISGDDIFVIYEQIPFDLEPGSTAYRDQQNEIGFTFPDNLENGVYYIALWVDDLDYVEESNENDNISFGDQVEIANSLPDLVVQNWYAEWDEFSGEGLLTYEVINEGIGIANGGWDVNLMLSTDETLGNGDDQYLAYETVDFTLAQGEYVYRDFSGPLYFDVSSIAPGFYNMALWVDDTEMVQEANERNNISWGQYPVSFGFGISPLLQLQDRQDTHRFKQLYNGRKLPSAEQVQVRKVLVSSTSDGGRQLRILEADSGPQRQVQSEPIVSKVNRSRNFRVFPITESKPMPGGQPSVP